MFAVWLEILVLHDIFEVNFYTSTSVECCRADPLSLPLVSWGRSLAPYYLVRFARTTRLCRPLCFKVLAGNHNGVNPTCLDFIFLVIVEQLEGEEWEGGNEIRMLEEATTQGKDSAGHLVLRFLQEYLRVHPACLGFFL